MVNKLANKERRHFAGAVSGDYEIGKIGVLDGIRAISIIIVVWFHFWQQSWIMPIAGPINLDWLPRHGCIMVDMMILLSAFCLFLPHAKSMVYGESVPTAKDFYIKRVARIFPCYYATIFIVLFCFALPLGEYASSADMWKDLITHLTFTNLFFVDTYIGTKLNVVLWTVSLLMIFYVIFPFLAKWFRKYPIVTYCVMVVIGLLSSAIISNEWDVIDQRMYTNHFFTFVGVYANGMLGAWLYMKMTKDRKRNQAESIFFTVVAIACIWLYKIMCDHRMDYKSDTLWQVEYRFLLSTLFLIFVISTILSVRWFRAIWDNKVMRFLSGISFNLYICHQYIAVKLKEFRIPAWEGDTPPNMTGDTVWQWQYQTLCIVVSLVVAIAMTYLIEKPAAKWIMKIYRSRKVKK